jgi:hypothetical protein
MSAIPNLAGVATADLVESIGAGKFSAAYINWSRTLHLLREHAPGWLPELVPANDGGILHAAPSGAFLLIRFRNMETGATTPAVPQAVMDTRNAAIPLDKITARDITDTHRRGACMAAALTFGLAYELWAKIPLESGYAAPEPDDEPVDDSAAAKAGDFAAAMNDADTPEALDAVAGQLKAASLPAPLLKGLRELYAKRKAALAKEAA